MGTLTFSVDSDELPQNATFYSESTLFAKIKTVYGVTIFGKF